MGPITSIPHIDRGQDDIITYKGDGEQVYFLCISDTCGIFAHN